MFRKFLLLALAYLCSVSFSMQAHAAVSAWSIQEAAALPDWLQFSVQHRSRYETLSNTFKAGRNGGDQVLAFRTQVFMEASMQQWFLGAEFIDSRLALDDLGTPVNTTLVNEVELLQAYLGWRSDNFMQTGLQAEARFGRQTMDIGSRRLVARNRYRNTLNNFNGLDFKLQNQRWLWRNFVVLPVSRLPNSTVDIRKGVVEFDEENFKVIFAGSFFSMRHLPYDSTGELYVTHLSEDDTASTPSKNRHITTPGFRLFRKSRRGAFDYELEATVQAGSSHASRLASDTAKLDHFAYFGHAAFGYTFDAPWQPQLLLQYDYASGDSDPNDNKNDRYETLYGARRFEYGPTSIWGAFARANINTPGIRLKFKPLPGVSGFIAHRAYWLAEKKDTWVGSGLRDRSGQSGSYIGQQLEARLRWQAIVQMLLFETGWAHLFKGEFAKNAPGSPEDKSDSDYFYVQTSIKF